MATQLIEISSNYLEGAFYKKFYSYFDNLIEEKLFVKSIKI